MARVRRIAFGFAGLCLGLLALVQRPEAGIIRIEGEMLSAVTVYMTKGLNAKKGSRNFTYLMYLPADSVEQTKNQTISNMRKTFAPNPTQTREFIDQFGNSALELTWNRDVSKIHVEMQFNAQIKSLFGALDSDAPFPAFIDDERKKFLVSTPLSPSNDIFVNYIGRAVSQNLYREIDVVSSIFVWLDRTIRLANHPEAKEHESAVSVLKKREGDEKGVSNLLVSLLKGLGIPARVAYGLSFQKEMFLEFEMERYTFDNPNTEKFWVEVYYPDLGWVSYDPAGMHFGSASHVLRLAAGPDSESASERWKLETGEAVVQKECIFDIKQDDVNVTVKGIDHPEINKLVLSPVLPETNLSDNSPTLDIEGLKKDAVPEELGPGNTGMILHNSTLTGCLDIVATSSRVYAQQFTLGFPARLGEIKLPLIKFSDSGKIWIEIYADEGGAPGAMLLKSSVIDSPRVRFMLINNPWLSFAFPASSRLEGGTYWFALRSAGSCIFHWYASEANAIGHEKDTRYMDKASKKPSWQNIANWDMCFQMLGTNLNRKD
jgi:transglutaminase-like putative cysteine protease